MLVFSFAGLLEAKQWALDTQKGRRNLDKWELGKIALKLKPEKEMAQAVGIGDVGHHPIPAAGGLVHGLCRLLRLAG